MMHTKNVATIHFLGFKDKQVKGVNLGKLSPGGKEEITQNLRMVLLWHPILSTPISQSSICRPLNAMMGLVIQMMSYKIRRLP